jgi:hypothetical protein
VRAAFTIFASGAAPPRRNRNRPTRIDWCAIRMLLEVALLAALVVELHRVLESSAVAPPRRLRRETLRMPPPGLFLFAVVGRHEKIIRRLTVSDTPVTDDGGDRHVAHVRQRSRRS